MLSAAVAILVEWLRLDTPLTMKEKLHNLVSGYAETNYVHNSYSL
jgi:hypothetical protein